MMDERKIFTLGDVARSIRKTLSERYRSAYWIKAELNKLNHYKYSGHCYPDLVEKEAGKITAQMRATLWKEDYHAINRRFLDVLKEPLKDGIKILFLARISFDAVYGLSLRIIDIDPAFTLGDLEQEKQACIEKLTKEEIFDANKHLEIPLLPQRIAVISVETSKGYADFVKMIDHNPNKYRFHHHLFPSLLQGDQAVDSIIHQLRKIIKLKQHFDVVVIVRGGGGDIGLSCYNNYTLAREVALSPLPVLTGIGHATNETVVEMVAYANEITPTKLAESLIQRFHQFAQTLASLENTLVSGSMQKLQHSKEYFNHQVHMFLTHSRGIFFRHRSHLRELGLHLTRYTGFLIKNAREYMLGQQMEFIKKQAFGFFKVERDNLSYQQKYMQLKSMAIIKKASEDVNAIDRIARQLHPANVLKRGYSITRQKGKSLMSFKEVKTDHFIETTLFDGVIISKVLKTETKKQ